MSSSSLAHQMELGRQTGAMPFEDLQCHARGHRIFSVSDGDSLAESDAFQKEHFSDCVKIRIITDQESIELVQETFLTGEMKLRTKKKKNRNTFKRHKKQLY